MKILKKEMLAVAVIDPAKKPGETGQYVRYKGNHLGLDAMLARARAEHFEIRRYVENMGSNGGTIPLKYVITEVPPGHVQPFHSHENVDEINLVRQGEMYFVESETLSENDREGIRAAGTLLREGDAVVSARGKRHTVANLSDTYTHLIGTLSAASSAPSFEPDWKR
ncbi:cupin domain-containing protein [Candidatus Kaiserbacteria bacterium]|nr:cupin domain-containing protein [Candidatus Kaiserbacteria bacterium]